MSQIHSNYTIRGIHRSRKRSKKKGKERVVRAEAGGQEWNAFEESISANRIVRVYRTKYDSGRFVPAISNDVSFDVHVHCVFHGLSPENDLANFTFYRFSL